MEKNNIHYKNKNVLSNLVNERLHLVREEVIKITSSFSHFSKIRLFGTLFPKDSMGYINKKQFLSQSTIYLTKTLVKEDLLDLKTLLKYNNLLYNIVIDVVNQDEVLTILNQLNFLNLSNYQKIIYLDVKNNNLDLLEKLEKYDQNMIIRYGYRYPNSTKYSDSFDCTRDEFIHAEKIFNFYADTIKEKNYTPFEQMICAYDILKSFKYKENEMDITASRYPHKVIKESSIVCDGYSYVFRHLLQKLKIPCVSYFIEGKDEKGSFEHRRNLVYLKDSKYHINGIYTCDVTWDSYNDSLDIGKKLDYYNFFMRHPKDFLYSTLIEKINAVNGLFVDDSILPQHIKSMINDTFSRLLSSSTSINDKKIVDEVRTIVNGESSISIDTIIEGIREVRCKEGFYNSLDELQDSLDLIKVSRLKSEEKYFNKVGKIDIGSNDYLEYDEDDNFNSKKR